MTKRSPSDLADMERRWREFWAESGIYRYDPSRAREDTYVVDTPPPTVSGALHIGHVMSYTHTDLQVRYRRMRGLNIFYPMGWDDNGLPTERRVQNVFNVRCVPTQPYDPDLDLEFGREGDVLAISRQNFIELCDRVVQEDEKKFDELFQRVGLSVDWSHTYATIDERSRFVSQLSFLRLLRAGQAELREAPTMWDVDFQTAVAQAEVEDREREGTFHRIAFDVSGGEEFVIATTRPELLPACIAVVAHPDDERYKGLFGKRAVTPLFRAPVPIVADESADPEKGTGILMVCTFGDAADVDQWRALGVPAREVIGRDGRIKGAPWGEDHWVSEDPDEANRYYDKLTGLSINQARKEIVEMLTGAGALRGDPEPTRRMVKYFEKGDRPLEFVVTRQWFVPLLDKKDALIEQGRKIHWFPDPMRKRYEDWVAGLNQDWCVSRQRFFGVPIPIWYRVDADGNVDHTEVLVPDEGDLPVDPTSDAPPGFTPDQRDRPGGFTGDPDVFDTWATSSLTPLIPTGWADDETAFERLYPTDLRPQAHDIIRTWAFYTIVRSYLEDGSIPWRNVAISGFVTDPDRKKMSKSKGNVVLPTQPLDDFGSDAVRYWAASARLGVDATFDTNVLREGRRLVIKLRNAARLVMGYDAAAGPPTHPLDRALLARLRALVVAATERWEDYDHAGALQLCETWFWSDFCDNYLELTKTRAYAGDPSAIGTLRHAIEVALRLFAPVLPFITEDIYNADRAEPASIHVQSWPTPDEVSDGEDPGGFDAAVRLLTEIRKAKSEAKASMRVPVEHLTVTGSRPTLDVLGPMLDDVLATGNVESHTVEPDDSVDDLAVVVRLRTAEGA